MTVQVSKPSCARGARGDFGNTLLKLQNRQAFQSSRFFESIRDNVATSLFLGSACVSVVFSWFNSKRSTLPVVRHR